MREIFEKNSSELAYYSTLWSILALTWCVLIVRNSFLLLLLVPFGSFVHLFSGGSHCWGRSSTCSCGIQTSFVSVACHSSLGSLGCAFEFPFWRLSRRRGRPQRPSDSTQVWNSRGECRCTWPPFTACWSPFTSFELASLSAAVSAELLMAAASCSLSSSCCYFKILMSQFGPVLESLAPVWRTSPSHGSAENSYAWYTGWSSILNNDSSKNSGQSQPLTSQLGLSVRWQSWSILYCWFAFRWDWEH